MYLFGWITPYGCGPLGLLSGAKYRKNCCHCYFQYKYSPMSGMRQVLSVYCFSWINDFFGPLFHDPQALCTGRDQAAMQIHYSWSYLKTIRSSNLLCLFSWVNFLCVQPNIDYSWLHTYRDIISHPIKLVCNIHPEWMIFLLNFKWFLSQGNLNFR